MLITGLLVLDCCFWFVVWLEFDVCVDLLLFVWCLFFVFVWLYCYFVLFVYLLGVNVLLLFRFADWCFYVCWLVIAVVVYLLVVGHLFGFWLLLGLLDCLWCLLLICVWGVWLLVFVCILFNVCVGLDIYIVWRFDCEFKHWFLWVCLVC